ncbi:MAG: MerR family transcriptional regulator, partial [Anaerolineales bacterium]|nr:MerR family transcriptional regulator [Anaerolineales bacterium]
MSKATLSIGAVARLFDISTKTLRHYEELGLLAPARADNGYRCYRPADVQQILRIRQLQALGLTLEQIHDILENEVDEDRWQRILQTILADINGQLDALTVRRQRV